MIFETNLSSSPFSTSLSPELGPRFEQALSWAHALHKQQARKGTQTPYICHLLSVAALVIEDGGSEDEVIAGLLHDAIEDQGRGGETAEKLRADFGNAVADIVLACSDTDQEPKPPWQVRKQSYLDHLKTASDSAIRVSVADKVHNLRSIVADYRRHGEQVWSRFSQETDPPAILWFYQTFVDIVTTRTDSIWIEELRESLATLERLRREARETATSMQDKGDNMGSVLPFRRRQRSADYRYQVEEVQQTLADWVDELRAQAMNLACLDKWRDWDLATPIGTLIELDDDILAETGDANINNILRLMTQLRQAAAEMKA